MQLPEEIEAQAKAERDRLDARIAADVKLMRAKESSDLSEFKSWFAENKEPIIVIAVICVIIGILLGFLGIQFFEHR